MLWRKHTLPLDLLLNDVPVTMELDTGAAVSVINESTFDSIRQVPGDSPLYPAKSKLKSYTGQEIQVQGTTQLRVRYKDKHLSLSIHVVSGNGPNLLGRDWLTSLEVNLQNLNSISSTSPLQQLLASHPTVFGEDLGCYNGPPVKLAVNKDAQPTFYKARPVPFALRSKVEDELTRLQSQGIISPVKHSVWAAPIVPVLKNSGRVRLCEDYKLTINKASPTETYPLPVVDELFANLSGGKYFSKLDLSNAYLQFPLDDASKQYVTINTHKGLFQFNRLPFGVASAPAIFQRHMEMLLQGLPNVSVYIDDRNTFRR